MIPGQSLSREQCEATSEQSEATDTTPQSLFHINEETEPHTTGIHCNATADNAHDASVDVELQRITTSDVTQDTSIATHDKGIATDIDSKSWQSLMQNFSTQQQIITMLRSEINS